MDKNETNKVKEFNGKSSAKIAGLKSTFTLTNEELLMTSFGRGNEAIIEKRVQADSIENISGEKPAFTLIKDSENAVTYRINGRNNSIGHTDNPFHRKSLGVDLTAKEDMIHAKTALENRYYGKAFSDNIHVQSIYNVLDIEKILAIHSNNIIYTLNNFLRTEGEDLTDFIGELTRSMKFSDLISSTGDSPKRLERKQNFERLCHAKQLAYLNIGIEDLFQSRDQTSNAAIKFTKEEFYYILLAFSDLRNMLAHGDHKQNIYKWSSVNSSGVDERISAVLDKLYSSAVNNLNQDFLNHSKNNLHILAEVMQATDPEKRQELVNRYYEFEVTKVYKNLGFSIKKVRELFVGNPLQAARLSDIEYDTVRAKLYRFIDFIIYDYCLAHPGFVLGLVEQLRACKNDEAKEGVYLNSAGQLWPEIGKQIMQLADLCRGEVFAKLKNRPDDSLWNGIDLKRVQISTKASWFTKFIYMMTCFMDGKEINDLLTTLINKFENIDSFYNVMIGVNLECNMQEPFSLFNQSDVIAKELRIVNSIARMRKPGADAKKIMFVEALQVLGLSSEEDELALAEEILTKESRPGKKDTGLRNFIANNVIESKRFHYLVRYGNPQKVKALINSRGIVAFILKDIPDAQILRYYSNAINGGETDVDKMRDAIADVLHGFSFDSIKGVKQRDSNVTAEEKEEKNKLRALVSLYLTILYLAVKNLVYVNSRYFLAFHCVERDRVLLDPGKWDSKKAKKSENKYLPEYSWAAFSEWFLQAYPPKKRVGSYLQKNMEKHSDWAINTFRNKVEHLDAVRNADLYLKEFPKDWEIRSWYDLYHYILQRNIQDQYEYDTTHESKKFPGQMIKEPGTDDVLLQSYFELLNKYHTPVKDFIKELNMPFAYNISRYKNLSIGDLFDKNRPVEKAEKLEA